MTGHEIDKLATVEMNLVADAYEAIADIPVRVILLNGRNEYIHSPGVEYTVQT